MTSTNRSHKAEGPACVKEAGGVTRIERCRQGRQVG